MINRNKIRNALLSFPPIRELLFFILQKKVYKGSVDKKISALLKGKLKLSEMKIDNLIVSLTSFPQRIDEVKYVIYSLLDQTILPEKIILWLAESQFPNKEQDLPQDLLAFKEFGFTIEWCEDLRSYKKLIPALELFPDHYVVTADDDLYYKRDWLEKIWVTHLKYPNNVVCHRPSKILLKNGDVLPKEQWKGNIRTGEESLLIYAGSGGGVLYHRKYLHKDVCKKDMFFNLAPHADDVWFYFMVIQKGTKMRGIKNPYFNTKWINPYREYGLINGHTLSSINIGGGLNDLQFKNVIDHYNIDLHSIFIKEVAHEHSI